MKVIILQHHEGYNPTDEVEIDDGIANYWIGVGIAVDAKSIEKKTDEEIEEKLTVKLKAAKKVAAGKKAKKKVKK